MDANVKQAIEVVEFWVDAWEYEQADLDDVEPCDKSEREVIKAVRVLLKEVTERPPANRPKKYPE